MPNQQIIKEFREKFKYDEEYGLYTEPTGENVNHKRIETFWLSKLEAQREDLLKKIEGMPTYYKREGFKNVYYFNKDEILKLFKH